MIAGQPAAIIFREGKAGHHFEDSNPFLLHLVKGNPDHNKITWKNSAKQAELRKKIYGKHQMSSIKFKKQVHAIQNKLGPNKEKCKSWFAYPYAQVSTEKYRID
jgi:hypothetical protein